MDTIIMLESDVVLHRYTTELELSFVAYCKSKRAIANCHDAEYYYLRERIQNAYAYIQRFGMYPVKMNCGEYALCLIPQ